MSRLYSGRVVGGPQAGTDYTTTFPTFQCYVPEKTAMDPLVRVVWPTYKVAYEVVTYRHWMGRCWVLTTWDDQDILTEFLKHYKP